MGLAGEIEKSFDSGFRCERPVADADHNPLVQRIYEIDADIIKHTGLTLAKEPSLEIPLGQSLPPLGAAASPAWTGRSREREDGARGREREKRNHAIQGGRATTSSYRG